MSNFRLSGLAQNALGSSVGATIDGGGSGGILTLYDGQQPPNANTAVSTQRTLAILTLGLPSFGPVVSGVITANPIATVAAIQNGLATWARITTSTGSTVFDCDVGLAGTTIVVNNVNVTANGLVIVNSFTITVPTG